MHRSATPDVVVVGAGMVGAACAEALSAAGVRVLVIDRDGPAAGTTASGEGNVLVSDKEPGHREALFKTSQGTRTLRQSVPIIKWPLSAEVAFGSEGTSV